jgi:hypothetical protein
VRDEGAALFPGIMAGEVSLLPAWRQLAAEKGGFVMSVDGDDGTRSAHGMVPRAALFLPSGARNDQALLRFCEYYRDAFGERGECMCPGFTMENSNGS